MQYADHIQVHQHDSWEEMAMKARSVMKSWPCALVMWAGCAGSASAKQPVPTAVFDLSLDDTSLQGEVQGSNAGEEHRLSELNAELRDMLAKSGCCAMVNLDAVAAQSRDLDMRTCNGCDVDLARKACAQISV